MWEVGGCTPEFSGLRAEAHNQQFSFSYPHSHPSAKPEFIKELAVQVSVRSVFIMKIICKLHLAFCSVEDSGSCLSKKTPRHLAWVVVTASLESSLLLYKAAEQRFICQGFYPGGGRGRGEGGLGRWEDGVGERR